MQLILTRTLLQYGVPLVTVARSDEGKHFVGVAYGDDEHLFVGVSAEALDSLLFAEVDLLGLMKSPGIGPILRCHGEVAVGDTLTAELVPDIPTEALPQSGLFLMTESQRA